MRVFNIIFKDLKVLLTDKKTLGLLIIMPILLTTILGAALGGTFSSDFDKRSIRIAVVKEYDFAYEKDKFMEFLNNNLFFQNINQEQLKGLETYMENFSGEFNPEEMFFNEFLDNNDMKKVLQYQVLDLEKAKELLRNNKISSIVILPEDFIYNMYVNFFPLPSRNELDIKIINNPDNYINNQIIEGVMNSFAEINNISIVGKVTYFETGIDEGIDMMTLSSSGGIIESFYGIIEEAKVKIEEENVDKKEPLSSIEYYAVAMTAMFILFAAGEGAYLLLEEKDNLTYARMTVAGVSKSLIAIGKYFTIFSFTLMQILVMILYSTLVLGVDWGDKWLVTLITLCTTFSIAGLGTMLASVSYKIGNYKMADAFSSILVFLLALIGGSYMPVEILPKFMHNLGNFIPNGAALKAYNKVMLGDGITQILPFLLSLIGMGVVFTLIAVYILNAEGGIESVKYNSAKTSKIEG